MLTAEVVHELLSFVGLDFDGADRELIDPIVDAALVCAEEEVPPAVLEPILEALWRDGLRADIERALDSAAAEHQLVALALDVAREDLGAGPAASALARGVVLDAAAQVAFRESDTIVCMLCLEDRASRAAPAMRAASARRVARLATRAAAVPESDVRAAVVRAALTEPPGDTAVLLATDARRRAVRSWLARLASLGAESMPNLSAALAAELAGPLPPPAADPVWRETVAALVGPLEPGLN
jgi:hypothetical protein